MNGSDLTDLFLARCAELVTSDPPVATPPPALQSPLMTYTDFCEFIYYGIHGDYSPLKGGVSKNVLAKLATPTDVALLSESDINSIFKVGFSEPLLYAKRTFTTVSQMSSSVADPKEVVRAAEPFMRHLIAKGYTVRYLAEAIKDMQQTALESRQGGPASFIDALNVRLRGENQTFDVYCIRILGGGGEDRGFKSIAWSGLPQAVRDAFLAHVEKQYGKLQGGVDPATTKRLGQLYNDVLHETRYVYEQCEAVDPYAAIEKFLNDYFAMKSIVYMTKKRKSSGKSLQGSGRNAGRSPVRLGELFIVTHTLPERKQQSLRAVENSVTFPYQKLKFDTERVRELAELYFSKCEVFRQLSFGYANALEAFHDNRVDDIFRNLGVATELAFQARFGHDKHAQGSKGSILQEGAILMALDWLRGQFEWITRHIKELYHGKSDRHEGIAIEDIILEERHWKSYMNRFPVIIRWRRDHLVSILKSFSRQSGGTPLEEAKNRYESELQILKLARHQYAHSTRIFRDRYFMALLLELFRVVLDFRFSCYTVSLENNLGRRVRTEGVEVDKIAQAFVSWEGEFAARVAAIQKDYAEIKVGHWHSKALLLGAGYVDFGRSPNDSG